MDKYINPVKERFRFALIPAILMGLAINVYISGVIIYANFPILLLSPLVGSIVFSFLFFLLKRSAISLKLAFLITSFTVTVEVIIHSYIFGWESGFFFYLYLLPLVFLLESNWKLWFTILFNVTVFVILIGLYYFLNEAPCTDLLSLSELDALSYLNGILTGIVAVGIIAYSGRTLNRRDQLHMDIIADLEASNRKIAKQHDQQKILLQEIHHRVKNNLQIISSLLSLQSQKIDDENVVGVLNESRSRVEAIALIHMKLYQDELGNAVDFKSYLEDFIVKQRILNPRINFALNAEGLILHLDIAVPLGLIVSELITNSVKHAFHGVETPQLTLELVQLGATFELWVRDNGIGLPEGFNFDSGDLGLGSDIITALTEQIDATMGYYNINGASFKIVFQNKAFD